MESKKRRCMVPSRVAGMLAGRYGLGATQTGSSAAVVELGPALYDALRARGVQLIPLKDPPSAATPDQDSPPESAGELLLPWVLQLEGPPALSDLAGLGLSLWTDESAQPPVLVHHLGEQTWLVVATAAQVLPWSDPGFSIPNRVWALPKALRSPGKLRRWVEAAPAGRRTLVRVRFAWVPEADPLLFSTPPSAWRPGVGQQLASLTPAEAAAVLDDPRLIRVDFVELPRSCATGLGGVRWKADPAVALTGAGQVVEIVDTGCDAGIAATEADPTDGVHPDLRTRLLGGGVLEVDGRFDELVVARDANPGWGDGASGLAEISVAGGPGYGHGSHVAGIVAGTGAESLAAGCDPHLRGIAPDAQLKIRAANRRVDFVGGTAPTTPDGEAYPALGLYGLGTDFDLLFDSAVPLHSNSWCLEYDPEAAYGEGSDEVDDWCLKHEDHLVIFAVGNTENRGELAPWSSPGGAKNVLSVGSLDAEGSRVASFSRGGVDVHKRRKPDLVAPGEGILSTLPRAFRDLLPADLIRRPDSTRPDAVAWTKSGTSMAAPYVAGVAACARQYLAQKGVTPSGPLLKALLVHFARPLADDDGRGGFGRILLDEFVADLMAEGDAERLHLVDGAQIAHLGSWAVSGIAADPGLPVRATLVWMDPAGPSLEWELSLVLESDGRSAGGNPEGVRDNVQRVEIQPGSSVRACVTARGDSASGAWPFALVLSNFKEGLAPPAVVIGMTAGVEAGVLSLEAGDGDAATVLSFQEQVANFAPATTDFALTTAAERVVHDPELAAVAEQPVASVFVIGRRAWGWELQFTQTVAAALKAGFDLVDLHRIDDDRSGIGFLVDDASALQVIVAGRNAPDRSELHGPTGRVGASFVGARWARWDQAAPTPGLWYLRSAGTPGAAWVAVLARRDARVAPRLRYDAGGLVVDVGPAADVVVDRVEILDGDLRSGLLPATRTDESWTVDPAAYYGGHTARLRVRVWGRRAGQPWQAATLWFERRPGAST